jgi:chromosome partitioning protein
MNKERRLANALASVQNQYDLIIIDCAPTESILTHAAYFACSHIIVPIKPESTATIGLSMLARFLKELQLGNQDHKVQVAGLVFAHSSIYTSGPEGQRAIKEVTDFANEEGWPICENQVRYSASYTKASREAVPIARTRYVRPEVGEELRRLKHEIFNVIGLAELDA